MPPNSRSDGSFGKQGAATDSVAPPDELAAGTRADQGFLQVLAQAAVSLVVTLQPGHVGCFGSADGRLTATFTPCTAPFGIACDDRRLVIAMTREIVAFALSTRLAPFYPPRPDHYDGIFLPVGSFRTGACNAHDIELDGPSVVFANTRFSCLSRSDATSSFIPLWQPPFISALMPDDRCHLNSFALGDGRIRYATAFASSDTRQGYRDLPLDAGVIIDVEANAIAAVGLLKPHSVRLFDNQLYVCNSAAGEVVQVDLAARGSTVVAELAGFTRGLRAVGDVLLVGLSTLRVTARELDLPFARRQEALTAGIVALDRRSGAELGRLSLPPSITEVLDFVAVPGVCRAYVQDPAATGPDIAIETPACSYWMKPGESPEPG